MKLIIIALALLIAFSSLNHIHTAMPNSEYSPSAVGNNSTISQIIQRAYEIVAGISALLIAILWVPIAIGYFSRDLDRKADAKERTKDALIGTIIFVMAITGVLYGVIHYIIVG